MDFIAAAFWFMTAVVGAYMLSRTVSGSRNAAGATVSDLPVALSFFHPTLAVTSLALLGGYFWTQEPWFAWLSFGGLVLTAFGGQVLFVLTLKGKKPTSSPVRRITAEQTIPIEVVGLHGLLAFATIALVFVIALRA